MLSEVYIVIYILYNELSNKGKPLKVARKLEKKYSKKEKVVLINIITAKENERILLERLPKHPLADIETLHSPPSCACFHKTPRYTR